MCRARSGSKILDKKFETKPNSISERDFNDECWARDRGERAPNRGERENDAVLLFSFIWTAGESAVPNFSLSF